MNIVKVGLLMAAISVVLVTIGQVFFGTTGMIVALIAAAGFNAFAFWNSDKMVLRMVRAKELSRGDAPEFFAMVERLVQRAELPMPKLFIVEDPSPNAFATGRSPEHSAVAVNRGLINMLDQDEVAGVVAHELAHIKNRDTLTMTIAGTMAGAITMIANLGQLMFLFGGMGGGSDEDGMNPFAALLMLIVGPIAATMLQLAISRAREFEADKLGAQIAGSSEGLAAALEKLEMGTHKVPTRTDAAHAPLYIVNPLKGSDGLQRLFMTHPPIAERVHRLRAMEVESPSSYDRSFRTAERKS